MEKRAFIAVLISLVLILVYPYYLQLIGYKPQAVKESPGKVQLSEQQTLSTQEETSNDTVMKNDTVNIPVLAADDTVDDTVIENNSLKIVLNKQNGAILDVSYKEKDGIKNLYSLKYKGLGLLSPTVSTVSFLPFSHDTVMEFKNSRGIARVYKLDSEHMTVQIIQEPELLFYFPKKVKLPFREQRYYRFVICAHNGQVVSMKPAQVYKKPKLFQNIDWFALSTRYYSLLFDPEEPFDIQVDSMPGEEVFGLKFTAKKEGKYRMNCYFGPNSDQLLAKYSKNWLKLLDYGFLSNLVKKMLSGLWRITHNYGLAIILLALLFNFIFLPLTYKSFKSMKKLQELQPEIQALREKYKDNPQAMNKEVLLLYRKYGVNPMSGCLPMLLQLPIFIALYNTLLRAYELKNAGFLWIKDLAEPDRFIVLKQSLPILGNEINLLPILMAGIMYFQQKQTPASTSSPGLWLMPILFGFIFYKFPAGLVLYWLTN
jgi:YidC/Oxa1 family membrane protein insertase